MAAQPKQKLPFRYGTVKRRINIGNFVVTPGQAIPSIVIPQVGMMARILIDVEGTYTAAAGSALNLLDGYDAIVQRAQIGLNNGSANILDLSGIGINQVNKNLSLALPIKRGLLVTTAAQTFSYQAILPVAANDRRQFEMGLINLQAPEIRATLNLAFNPLSSIFADTTKITLFTATCNVSYEYWEIPDLSVYQMPPLTLVRTIEEAPQAIAATGVQLYQIPRLGTMIEYHGVLVINNVYANVRPTLSESALRYNKSDVQYDVLIDDQEVYEAEIYGGASSTFMDPHAVTWNFWTAGDRGKNGGDFRDAIDTEENTTTEWLHTVLAGTTLPANVTNALYHVRRVVQRITQTNQPTN